MWTLLSKLLYRILSILVAIPVGRAISRLVEHAWTAARPDHPPRDPKRAETSWRDAITWAVISGVGVALRKLVATKGTAGAWRAIVGTPPPGREKHPSEPTLT
ncbi:MAG: DUF4235 domain-containing protein [Actinomycetota bacterium]|nr:DUF4235 domain-containing protein [Actinomycetota bacterium]